MNFEEGELLLLDKPQHWTSFDVVNKLRYALKKKYGRELKVGHCGTLDPLATGLLLICTGRKTKLAETLSGQDKEYTGTITLGATTPSFDAETAVENTQDVPPFGMNELQHTASAFVGETSQMPPAFSAKKVDGKVAYQLARKGKPLELRAQQIRIEVFEITGASLPDVHFRVRCSKGTYIRSLANDFGKALGCGAYLSSLRRTASGNYRIEDAVTLEQMLQIIEHLSAAAN